MEYLILINYDQGDSNGWERGLEDKLELKWHNLEVAKENLKRIQEHYQWRLDVDPFANRGRRQEIENSKKDKAWYCNEIKFPEGMIYLLKDDGSKFTQQVFWSGYFERLNSAEIKSINNELRIEF